MAVNDGGPAKDKSLRAEIAIHAIGLFSMRDAEVVKLVYGIGKPNYKIVAKTCVDVADALIKKLQEDEVK